MTTSTTFLFLVLKIDRVFSLRGGARGGRTMITTIISFPRANDHGTVLALRGKRGISLSIGGNAVSGTGSAMVGGGTGRLLACEGIRRISSAPRVGALTVPEKKRCRLVLSSKAEV